MPYEAIPGRGVAGVGGRRVAIDRKMVNQLLPQVAADLEQHVAITGRG
jgi:hypothetical protein